MKTKKRNQYSVLKSEYSVEWIWYVDLEMIGADVFPGSPKDHGPRKFGIFQLVAQHGPDVEGGMIEGEGHEP